MSANPEERPVPDVERLVLALAKTFHWAGLYGADHPVLRKRVEELHAAIVSRLPSEPEGQLLLGIARDKVLYRNRFAGEGQEIIGRFTESLYLKQVATVGFGDGLTAEGLLALLAYLNEPPGAEGTVTSEQFLRRDGVRGISLSPYNYRELLSRKLAEPDGRAAGSDKREEELWRVLITSDFDDNADAERKVVEEIAEYPELLRAIMRRAREGRGPDPGGAAAHAEGAVSPEVLRRLLRRMGTMIRALPEERRRSVFASLDAEPDGSGGAAEGAGHPVDLLFARSVTDGISDDEFLDLLGTLLSVEGKGGLRLRRIFGTLAMERDVRGSLLPRAGVRKKESLKAKNYYDLKTWETIEKLLLSRSEEAYLGGDHARFLEEISAARGPYAARLAARPDDAPAPAPDLGAEEMRRRTIAIFLELLAGETREGEFFDLLEEIRKAVPNLISRRDVPLLGTVLASLEAIAGSVRAEWQPAVREVLLQTDFGQVTELCLAGGVQEADGSAELLSRFGAAAARPILDRLLNEPEAVRRRALIRLAVRLGPAAAPEIASMLSHPKWYFVRNLCTILGEIGDRRALAGLMRAAGHPDARVRREAILAVGKLGGAEAAPGLGRILLEESLFSTAKDDQVRIDAASALYRIGGTEALSFLHRGRHARRAAVREHCEGLVQSLGGT